MKEISIIKYGMQNCNGQQKTAIKRAINGYNDYSNNGKYNYKRKGLLDEIPHTRISKGVILIDKRHKIKLLRPLKKYGASYTVINVFSKS